MSNVSYLDQPCDRCGSKRRVSRKWKEKVPTFTGKLTVVEYTQVICTNPECQRKFEENIKKETKKREVIRLQKEENDKIRKDNSLKAAKRAKILKNRSRI